MKLRDEAREMAQSEAMVWLDQIHAYFPRQMIPTTSSEIIRLTWFSKSCDSQSVVSLDVITEAEIPATTKMNKTMILDILMVFRSFLVRTFALCRFASSDLLLLCSLDPPPLPLFASPWLFIPNDRVLSCSNSALSIVDNVIVLGSVGGG